MDTPRGACHGGTASLAAFATGGRLRFRRLEHQSAQESYLPLKWSARPSRRAGNVLQLRNPPGPAKRPVGEITLYRQASRSQRPALGGVGYRVLAATPLCDRLAAHVCELSVVASIPTERLKWGACRNAGFDCLEGEQSWILQVWRPGVL